MANATVPLVLDRLYAINLRVSGANVRRYFPQSPDSAMLPVITAMFGRSARDLVSVSRTEDKNARVYNLLVIVEAWMAGIPTESGQKDAETLIELIRDTYLARPLLEYNGVSLDGVESAVLSEDSGIETFGEQWVAIRIPLSVTTIKSFTLNTSDS